jgi:hypothetical protein
MKCAIINKNYPPNSGVTGYYASKLAEYLMMRGVDVTIVTTSSNYGGLRSELTHGRVVRIESMYQGKNKYLRLISSLYEGFQLARCVANTGVSPWICMTDPPLLNIWIGFKAMKLNIPWAFWSMDLYPDAFCAAGLVKREGFAYKFIHSLLLKNIPNYLIGLGRIQADYIAKEYRWDLPMVILPCGISSASKILPPPKWAAKDNLILFGYAGNIGEAHSVEFLIEVAKHIDVKKHRLILSVYGVHAKRILENIKDIDGVIVVDWIEQSDLQFIDIHLVSLLPKWDNICVPSKAVASVCQGGALLYCGSEKSDNWDLLGECGWRIDPGKGIAEQVGQFLKGISKEALKKKKEFSKIKAEGLLEMEKVSFEEIFQFVKKNACK